MSPTWGLPDSLMNAAWGACTKTNQLVMVVTLTSKNPDAPPQPSDSRAVISAYEWRHPRAEIKFTPGATHAKTTPYASSRCTSSSSYAPVHWVHRRGKETLVDLRGASPTEHVQECWPDLLVERVELRNEEFFDAETPLQHSVLVYDTMED